MRYRTLHVRLGHDRAAIGLLAALPVVIFVLPALAGYPVLPGDDLTQNFPLRVLVGWQLRHGHLPLLDPYIWSGAPLLGGWNAGAAYPLTLLFAVLPGVAAWTINMTVTWWVAGLSTFAFLRASRLSPAASVLGALSFAFAGTMTAQIPHFGLVAGLSWVPVALLALLRLSQRPSLPSRLASISALAIAVALVILAGEPRSIDDGVIIIVCYAGWRAWRLGRWPDGAAYLAAALAGVTFGVAIGAVQWLPGIEAVLASQRVAHGAGLFGSGSLVPQWLLLSLVPDLMGGSGSFGQPVFFARYNLTEVTAYIGLMPLVAACALLGQLRGRRLPEWAIWHLVAVLGVLLALGGNTALGQVLARLPIVGDQRLQSRNMMIADLALAILLAYWADHWLREPRTRRGQGAPAGALAGVIPGIAVIGVVVTTLAWGAGMMRWLSLAPVRAGHAGALRPWLAPSLVLGGLAVALVWWGPRLGPGRRMRALAGFVAADITVFTVLAVVSVAPGLGRAGQAAAVMGGAPSAAVPVGAFTRGGRFAVYDPGLLSGVQLSALGGPDGNVMESTPSVQGYGSIVDATYAMATGSHQAAGDGQDVLDPRVIGNGTLDELDTTVLLAPAAYLITAASQAPAAAHRGPGFRALAPHQSATWFFASLLPVTSVTIPVAGTAGSSGRGVSVGLVRSSGSIDRMAVTPDRAGRLDAVPAGARGAVGVRVAAGSRPAGLGPPVITTAGGGRYRADGPLQDALVPPRWSFAGFDGAFAVFRNSMARPALSLQALPHTSTAGALIRATEGPKFAPTSAQVSSAHGVTVIRAVADIAGWTATWRAAGTRAADVLPIHRRGLVQAVRAPAGRGTMTWSYSPPGGATGLRVSLAALALLIGAGVAAASARPRRGPAAENAPEDAGARPGLSLPLRR